MIAADLLIDIPKRSKSFQKISEEDIANETGLTIDETCKARILMGSNQGKHSHLFAALKGVICLNRFMR